MKQYIEGFPQTQAEHAEWKGKYEFDIGAGKWFDPATQTTDPNASVAPEAPAEPMGDFTVNNLPGDTPDLTGAQGRLSFLTEQSKQAQKAAEQARKDYEAKQADFQKEQKSMWDKLLKKETTEEKREAEYEKLGFEPKEYFEEREAEIAEVGKLMEGYDNKVAQMDMAVAQIEGRPGIDIGLMTREGNEIKKKYNVELSQMSSGIKTKLAIMEMKQGNMEQARSFVREAVADYTYDLKLEYMQFEQFKTDNQAVLDNLDNKYINALNKSENYALEAWKSAENQATQIGDLMLNYQGAGITFNDTLEEAVAKVSKMPVETKGYAPTALMKEYQYAVGQGYKGSFAEFSGKGGGISDEDLADYITAFFYGDTPITSREQAVKELNDHATSIMLRLGKNGYDLLVAEINDKFPQLPEAPKVKPKTAEEIGKEAGGFAKELPAAYIETMKKPLGWAEKGGEAVGGFFKELFGF